MNFWKESIQYHSVRLFGVIIRKLPLSLALKIGKGIGTVAYYFDIKHKAQAHVNLRRAFSTQKSPDTIKRITKELFKNYGQNLIELFRMPLMNTERFQGLVDIEGREHIENSLQQGKGVILLAMHFGSWEMASLSCGFLGHPYKMFVNPQAKHSRLDELLNSYRSCGGSLIIHKGTGTRDFIRSLKNNEIVGMVVDQGGKDGVLVPFMGREASLSSGAIRMGLKMDVPLCFAAITRKEHGQHKMIIHPPLKLTKTENAEKNVFINLKKVVRLMEYYIVQYPAEYMWFYKIWKYAKEATISIISDGKAGHLRQSQTVAKMMQKALIEKGINATIETAEVKYKNKISYYVVSFLCLLYHPMIFLGRFGFLQKFLTKNSLAKISSLTPDYVLSCGSSAVSLNYFLARDFNAKNLVILNPGLLGYNKFNLTILPKHDASLLEKNKKNVILTNAAPNLITPAYLKNQTELLLNRFSHLKTNLRFKICIFIGGNSRHVYLSEKQIKVLIRQVEEIAHGLKAHFLITTSRRTPLEIERWLQKKLKKNPLCPLLILANQENVPETVGGMLGLADLVVASGDSISMVSEAASSGKRTVVFMPQTRAKILKGHNKHKMFVDNLNAKGFIRSCDVKHIGQSIYDLAKNKSYTRLLDDNPIIFEALRKMV